MGEEPRTLDEHREPMDVVLVRARGPEHRAYEDAALRAGVAYPLWHRVAWQEAFGSPESLLCACRDGTGAWRAGAVVEVASSRALPGHRLLRVERYAPPADAAAGQAILQLLRDEAFRDGRVLRLSIEVFCRDPERRALTGRALEALGFTQPTEPRGYRHTLVLDLQPDEDALLAGMHRSARRNIRELAKHPVDLRPVVDPSWAPRIAALAGESMRRTGGRAGRQDWAGRIAFSHRYPDLSRFVALFRRDAEGPEALLAFAWGCHDGEYAHYDAAGATRSTDRRIPLAYPLLWDLICWAKRASARWFDFGGVTLGHLEDGQDPLGGISDFKRYFAQEAVEVGSEWVIEPHPLRASLARALGALVASARQFRGRIAPREP